MNPIADDIGVLARQNPCPRDDHITFDEERHVYFIDGREVFISVTGLIHEMFPHFNPQQAVTSMLNGKEWPNKPKHQQYKALPIWGEPPAAYGVTGTAVVAGNKSRAVELISREWKSSETHITDKWDADGKEAAAKGTCFHYMAELYMNGHDMTTPARQLQFKDHQRSLQFLVKYDQLRTSQGWIKYRTEQRLWDVESNLAGSCDMQWRLPALNASGQIQIIIDDWKRCKDIKMWNDFQRGCIPATNHLPDCNHAHYCVQLNLYRYKLIMHYNVDVVGMNIVVFHPDQDDYKYFPVPLMQDTTTEIMVARMNAERARRRKMVDAEALIETTRSSIEIHIDECLDIRLSDALPAFNLKAWLLLHLEAARVVVNSRAFGREFMFDSVMPNGRDWEHKFVWPSTIQSLPVLTYNELQIVLDNQVFKCGPNYDRSRVNSSVAKMVRYEKLLNRVIYPTLTNYFYRALPPWQVFLCAAPLVKPGLHSMFFCDSEYRKAWPYFRLDTLLTVSSVLHSYTALDLPRHFLDYYAQKRTDFGGFLMRTWKVDKNYGPLGLIASFLALGHPGLPIRARVCDSAVSVREHHNSEAEIEDQPELKKRKIHE